MEQIVEVKLDEMMNLLVCCGCVLCRNDIMAYALNRLPPKYVVSTTGEVYTKMDALKTQHGADIVAALTHAVQAVSAAPRHSR